MNFKKTIANSLALPKEVVLQLPLVTLLGREELSIENHKGILLYSENCIRIATKIGTMELTGTTLSLKQLGGDILIVHGTIDSILFLT
ncbi:MAG: sporulation protein YqfC [Bacillota bacterium]